MKIETKTKIKVFTIGMVSTAILVSGQPYRDGFNSKDYNPPKSTNVLVLREGHNLTEELEFRAKEHKQQRKQKSEIGEAYYLASIFALVLKLEESSEKLAKVQIYKDVVLDEEFHQQVTDVSMLLLCYCTNFAGISVFENYDDMVEVARYMQAIRLLILAEGELHSIFSWLTYCFEGSSLEKYDFVERYRKDFDNSRRLACPKYRIMFWNRATSVINDKDLGVKALNFSKNAVAKAKEEKVK